MILIFVKKTPIRNGGNGGISLENGGILLKKTTKRVEKQKGGQLRNVLAPSTKLSLQLMKHVLTPIAKAILKLLELTTVGATQSKI